MKVKLTTVNDVKNFCNAASECESDVFVGIGRYIVDGKSILGLFSLNLTNVLNVTFIEKRDGEKNKFESKIMKYGFLVEADEGFYE